MGLGCSGPVGILGSTFPSIIDKNSKANLEKMSRTAGVAMPQPLGGTTPLSLTES